MRPLALATAAVALVAATGAGLAALRLSSTDAPTYTLGASRRITFEDGLEVDPAISPDGRFVAYAAGPDSAMRLYVRQLAGGAPVPVSTNLGGSQRRPRWSPDGTRLLFQAERGIWVVPALGGAARPVAAAPDDTLFQVHSAEWSPDGRQVAYVERDSLMVRPAAGGGARGIAQLTPAHSLAWSPDGRWIAVVVGNVGFTLGGMPSELGLVTAGNLAPSAIWIVPAGGGARVPITDEGALNGSPTWLDAGRTLAFVSSRDGPRDVYVVRLRRDGSPDGAPARLTSNLGAHTVSASHDGRTLAYSALRVAANVWSVPIDDGSGTRGGAGAVQVTFGQQTVESPVVSPDGAWLAFDSDRSGNQDIYRVPLAAPGAEPERLVDLPTDDFRPAWSPDGRWIAFYTIRDGLRQTAIVPARGGTPVPLFPGRIEESHSPTWSGDGRRIAFFRLVGPEYQVFETRRIGDSAWGTPRQLTRGRGDNPQWSPAGETIAYLMDGGVRLMEASAGDSTGRWIVPPRDPRLGGVPVVAVRWTPDGRALWVRTMDAIGAASFWSVPVDGGAPRRVARTGDSRRSAIRSEFSTDGRRIYLSLLERESDVWTLELRGR